MRFALTSGAPARWPLNDLSSRVLGTVGARSCQTGEDDGAERMEKKKGEGQNNNGLLFYDFTNTKFSSCFDCITHEHRSKRILIKLQFMGKNKLLAGNYLQKHNTDTTSLMKHFLQGPILTVIKLH